MNSTVTAHCGIVDCTVKLAEQRTLTHDEKVRFKNSLDYILDRASHEFTHESDKTKLAKYYTLRGQILMGWCPQFTE